MKFFAILFLLALASCASQSTNSDRKIASEYPELMSIHRCHLDGLSARDGVDRNVSFVDGGEIISGRSFIRIDNEMRNTGSKSSQQVELKNISRSVSKDQDRASYEGKIQEGDLTVLVNRAFKNVTLQLFFGQNKLELACDSRF